MHASIAVVFASISCLAIVWPVLPFQAIALGGSPQTVTALFAVDTVMMLLVASFWGHLSDRIGRKPVVLLGLALAVPAYLLMATATSLEMLFASRIVAGLGGATLPVLQAYIADRTTTDQRVSGMAGFNGAYGLAFVIGPLITNRMSGPDGGNYHSVAYTALVFALLAFCLAAIVIRREPRGAPQDTHDTVRFRWSIYKPLFGTLCFIPLVGILAVGFVYAELDATIGLWSDMQLGWDARQLSIVYALGGIAAVVTQLVLVTRLSRWFDEGVVAAAAVAAILGAFACFVVVPGSASTGVAMVLFGAGVATANTCLISLISKAVADDVQGSVIGATYSALSVTWILGPLWGGFSLETFGPDWPFITGGMLLAAALVLLSRLPRAVPVVSGVQQAAE